MWEMKALMQELSQEPRDVAAEGLKAFKQVDHEFAVLLVHNVVLVGLEPGDDEPRRDGMPTVRAVLLDGKKPCGDWSVGDGSQGLESIFKLGAQGVDISWVLRPVGSSPGDKRNVIGDELLDEVIVPDVRGVAPHPACIVCADGCDTLAVDKCTTHE